MQRFQYLGSEREGAEGNMNACLLTLCLQKYQCLCGIAGPRQSQASDFLSCFSRRFLQWLCRKCTGVMLNIVQASISLLTLQCAGRKAGAKELLGFGFGPVAEAVLCKEGNCRAFAGGEPPPVASNKCSVGTDLSSRFKVACW